MPKLAFCDREMLKNNTLFSKVCIGDGNDKKLSDNSS